VRIGKGVFMATLHVLKVFVGEGGAGGNPLGVFLDRREVPEEERQRVATATRQGPAYLGVVFSAFAQTEKTRILAARPPSRVNEL
jgi:hypothetical protein